MTDIDYLAHAKKMKTPDLIRWTSGFRPGTDARMAGEHELQTRRSRGAEIRGWFAIGISIVSLAVAVFAYLKR